MVILYSLVRTIHCGFIRRMRRIVSQMTSRTSALNLVKLLLCIIL